MAMSSSRQHDTAGEPGQGRRQRRIRGPLPAVMLVGVFLFMYFISGCSTGGSGLFQGTNKGGINLGSGTSSGGGTGSTGGTGSSGGGGTTTGGFAAGSVLEYGIPGLDIEVSSVAVDTSGNVYFTLDGSESGGGFGVVPISGNSVIAPTLDAAVGIQFGFDSQVWVSEVKTFSGPLGWDGVAQILTGDPTATAVGGFERFDPTTAQPSLNPQLHWPPTPAACTVPASPSPVSSPGPTTIISFNLIPVVGTAFSTTWFSGAVLNMTNGNCNIGGALGASMFFTDGANTVSMVYTDQFTSPPGSLVVAEHGGLFIAGNPPFLNSGGTPCSNALFGFSLNPNGLVAAAAVFGPGVAPGGIAGCNGICQGPDGQLWVTETNASIIMKVSQSLGVTEFNFPRNNVRPIGIAAGPDGNLWFAQSVGNQVGRITTNGTAVAPISLLSANAGAAGIAQGPDGNMWVVEVNTNNLAQISTAPGNVVQEFPVPMRNFFQTGPGNVSNTVAGLGSLASGIVANPTTKQLYFAGPSFNPSGGGNPGCVPGAAGYGMGNQVGVVDLQGHVTEIAHQGGSGSFTAPASIILDPTTGNYVFTEFFPAPSNPDGCGNPFAGVGSSAGQGNQITIWAPSPSPQPGSSFVGGTMSTFGVFANGFSEPAGICIGSDGNFWIAEQGNNAIGKLAKTGGAVIDFLLTGSVSGGKQPVGIVNGPDGNLWFTEQNNNAIGVMDTSGHLLNEIKLGGIAFPGGVSVASGGTTPVGICVGPDKGIWFTEQLGGVVAGFPSNDTFGAIGRIDPTTMTLTNEFAITSAPNTKPTGICAGPDGNLWFTENVGNNIGRISTTGTISEFAVSTANAGLFAITAAADGGIWFTELSASNIGRISIDGSSIQEFFVPTGGGAPGGLAPGVGLQLLFTETAREKIGTVNIANP